MAVNVRLKHSSVDGKAPVASDLLEGEVALNIHQNSPAAYIKDSNGDIVKLAGAGSVTDADAVKKSETASQNMAGDLTLGTDKITLDAGTGEITADGVRAEQVDVTQTGSGYTYIGRKSDGTATFFIGDDGSGKFAADTIVGENNGSASTNASGIYIGKEGYISYFKSSSEASDFIVCRKHGNANPVASIASDGSLNAAGDVKIGGTLPSSPNITLSAAGSITAAGDLQVGESSFSGNDDGVIVQTNGRITASAADGSDVWNGFTTGGNRTSVIGADGSITAAGGIRSLGDAYLGTSEGVLLNGGPDRNFPGSIDVCRDGATNLLWKGWQKGITSPTSQITADGSITAAGNVTVGDYQSGTAGKNGFQLRSWGELVQNRNGGDAYTLYNNSAAKTVIISADGSTTFGVFPQSTSINGNSLTKFNASSTANIICRKTDSLYNTYHAFEVQDNTSAVTASITGTGSATFAGVCKVDRTVSGDGCFHAALNGTVKASIKSDGSILCDGSVTSGSLAPGGGGGNYFYNGEVAAYSPSASNTIFRGWDASGSTNSLVASIYANGNAVFVGSVTASNVSDVRFKENITDAKPQLADTVALGSQLKNWDWKDDAPLNEELRARRFLGLVAQEAEKVCPELTYTVPRIKQGKELTPEVVVPAVYETKTVPAVLDDEGEVIEEETTEEVLVTEEQVTPATYEQLDDSYKAINHDILVMKLLGAVAELKAEVDALKAVSS